MMAVQKSMPFATNHYGKFAISGIDVGPYISKQPRRLVWEQPSRVVLPAAPLPVFRLCHELPPQNQDSSATFQTEIPVFMVTILRSHDGTCSATYQSSGFARNVGSGSYQSAQSDTNRAAGDMPNKATSQCLESKVQPRGNPKLKGPRGS